jgi:uncharacterized membrane protein
MAAGYAAAIPTHGGRVRRQKCSMTYYYVCFICMTSHAHMWFLCPFMVLMVLLVFRVYMYVSSQLHARVISLLFVHLCLGVYVLS